MLIKRLKKLVISVFIMVLSVAVLSTSAGAIVTWHSEQAATGQNYPRGLGYDADGRPAFVQHDYSGKRAIYRYKCESGSWKSETAASITKEPVLSFSNSGKPYVLYYHDNKLSLVKREGENNWQEEGGVIDEGYMDVYSLAFNSSGYPCVSYTKYDELYYAAYNGSTWQKQKVYSADDLINNNLTFNGPTPAIIFATQYEGLKYAYYSGGKWRIETVDELPHNGMRNRLNYITLRFGNGKPLISYNDRATNSLKFAYALNGN